MVVTEEAEKAMVAWVDKACTYVGWGVGGGTRVRVRYDMNLPYMSLQ